MRAALFCFAVLFLHSSTAIAQQDGDVRPAGPCFHEVRVGSGPTYFRACVSRTGNITSLESPLGVEHVNVGAALEGWAVCRGDDWYPAADFDAGREDEDNLGAVGSYVKQPNGPNTLPLTIFHNLWANLKVVQYISHNPAEREITFKMAVRNNGSATVPNVVIHRMIDPDVDGDWTDDLWASTADSVTILDGGAPGRGVSLTAATPEFVHETEADYFGFPHDFKGGRDYACAMGDFGAGGKVASSPADYLALASYYVGDIRPNEVKTVTFTYRVF